jgi:hypothetical protein
MNSMTNDKLNGTRIRRNARFEWSVLIAAAFVLLVLAPAFSSASVISLSTAVSPAWQASVHSPVWSTPSAALKASAPESCQSALRWLESVSTAQTSEAQHVALTSYFDRTAPGEINLQSSNIHLADVERRLDHQAASAYPAILTPEFAVVATPRDDASRRLLVHALSPHEGALLSGTRTNRYHE